MPRVSASPDSVSGPESRGAQWPQLYAALGITTVGTVLLLLSLRRIFAVVFYDHFALAAILLAALGLGAGGAFSYAMIRRRDVFAELGRLTFINSVSVVLLLWFLLSRHGGMTAPSLIVVSLASAVPFFFAGAVLAIGTQTASQRIEMAYLSQVLGVAAACLLAIPFLRLFGAPNTVIGAGVAYGAASSIWFNRAAEEKLRALAVLVALLLVALIGVNGLNGIFEVHWAKDQALSPAFFTRWNHYSYLRARPMTESESADGSMLEIDGDQAAAIPAIPLEGVPRSSSPRSLLGQATSLPYQMRPGADALVVGSGAALGTGGAGGAQASADAIALGSRSVMVIESNSGIPDSIGREPAVNPDLYALPQIELLPAQPRIGLANLPPARRFDVIAVPAMNSAAALAAGAPAFLVQNLYTVETLSVMLDRLTDDGILSIALPATAPPAVLARLRSTAIEALSLSGQPDGSHTLAVAGARSQVLLVARSSWSSEDMAIAVAAGIQAGWQFLDPSLLEQPASLGNTPANQAALFPFDLSPATDDRPFLFYFADVPDLWDALSSPLPAVSVPSRVGLALSIASLLTLMALWRLTPRLVVPLPESLPLAPASIAQHALIAAGWIVVAFGIILRMAPSLGGPTFVLTAMVLPLLVATGAGLYLHRHADPSPYLAAGLLAAVVGWVLLIVLSRGWIGGFAASSGLVLRILIALHLMVPIGVFTGAAMAAILPGLKTAGPLWIPWIWSMQIAAACFGFTLALGSAIHLGLPATLSLGAACYAIAMLLDIRRARKTGPESAA